MFRPISFWLTFHWGWRDPNETPAFPRWQWAMLLHSVGAGERGDPSLPNGLSWKNRRPHRLSHISHAHIHSSCTLHTLGAPSPLSRKFRHEQLWGVREWQVYSRFQQAHRREADWQLSGITTRVEAVCRTKWAACLSASLLPPRGFLGQALCLSLDVYTSLRFPCLISALSFKEQACIGVRWKQIVSGQAWEEESSAAEEAVSKHFSSCQEELFMEFF